MKVTVSSETVPSVEVRDMEMGEVYKRVGSGHLYMKTDEAEWPLISLRCGTLCTVTSSAGQFIHMPDATLHA
jgi:hypothetical protein